MASCRERPHSGLQLMGLGDPDRHRTRDDADVDPEGAGIVEGAVSVGAVDHDALRLKEVADHAQVRDESCTVVEPLYAAMGTYGDDAVTGRWGNRIGGRVPSCGPRIGDNVEPEMLKPDARGVVPVGVLDELRWGEVRVKTEIGRDNPVKAAQ